MASDRKVLVIADLRGGRNGDDPPLSLPESQCVEAMNVDWFTGTVARKRGGHTDVSLTGTNFTAAPGVAALVRHHAGGATDELWARGVGGGGVQLIARLATGTWTNPTLKDAPLSSSTAMRGASFDDKLFLAYVSSRDRLHVWDGSTVRRAGLAEPSAAPTVANTGAGAYPATIRYYTQAYIDLSGSDIRRRSELSAVVSFTPSGAGTAARVTKAAAVNEGETDWELYGSADNLLFFKIATIAVGTTTYDDSANPTTYSSGTAAPTAGANALFPSVRYLTTDGSRLLGANNGITGAYNRVYFTSVLGASDVGDAERVPNQTSQKNWIDLDPDDGDFITGFGGPVQGVVFVFKQRQIWRLTPTGNADAPYDVKAVTKTHGAITQEAIANGEDQDGSPCIYFMSQRGPYRLGKAGVEFLGNGVLDRLTVLPTVTIWHEQKHQVWWLLAGSSGNVERLVYDVRHQAWSRQAMAVPTGATGLNVMSAAMYSSTIDGLSDMLAPYIGGYDSFGPPLLLQGDTTATTDAGGLFQAYVTTKAYAPGGLTQVAKVEAPILTGVAAAGVAIQVTVMADFGVESRAQSVLLQPKGSETRVIRKLDLPLSSVTAVQYTIGDAAAVSNTWTLDALAVPYAPQEPR